MRCSLLVAHPKLPIIFIGSDDGRFFIFAFNIEYCPPPINEEDEFSGDEDADNDTVSFERARVDFINWFAPYTDFSCASLNLGVGRKR